MGNPSLETLTRHEQEVLLLLLQGLTNAEIAARLYKSAATIKWYVRQINNKLGTHNRGQIIQWARQAGITAPVQSARPNHNLPAPLTQFVGRKKDLAELEQLLNNPDVRLISLVAQGGMGKTRLALEAARQRIPRIAQGIYFIDLTAVDHPGGIVPAVAYVLNYQFQDVRGNPLQELLDLLRDREYLLVLDNFDHLLEGAPILTTMLHAAPGLKLLVTTQERLDLEGETVLYLRGLDLPAAMTLEDATHSSAMQLFLETARYIEPNLVLTQEIFDDVVQMLHLVQGLPLAILICAHWLSVLSPAQIVHELRQSLDFLSTSSHQFAEKHRSIRAVLNYSWRHLSEPEQQIFMKLSVFPGSFTREAAEKIAGANLHILLHLVNKSLLHHDSQTGRYDIHALSRQFAGEILRSSSEYQALIQCYCAYFSDFMLRCEQGIKYQQQQIALRAIDADFDSIRQAWEYAVRNFNRHVLESMLEGLYLYAETRQRLMDTDRLFDIAEARFCTLDDAASRLFVARLRVRYLRLHILTSGQASLTLEGIEHQLSECLAEFRQTNRQEEIALCLLTLFMAYTLHGKQHAGDPLIDEAQRLYRDLEMPFYLAQTHNWKGLGSLRENYAGKVDHFHQALQISRAIGDMNETAWILCNLALVVGVEGKYEQEMQYVQEAHSLMREINNHRGVFYSCCVQGNHQVFKGDFEQAAALAVDNQPFLHGHRRASYAAGALGIRALIAIVHTNTDEANKFATEILNLPDKSVESALWAWGHPYAYFVLGVLAIDAGDELAMQQHYHALANAVMLYDFRLKSLLLMLAVMRLWTRQEYAPGIKIAAFLLAQDSHINGWITRWSRVQTICDEMRQAIGAEAFQQAWQAGEMLDWQQILHEISQ